ncbi:MAG: ATP-grasp domain-containing protein [bacterium]
MERKKHIGTIAIVYNLKKKNSVGDECEEYDEIETIHSLREEIRKYGFRVRLIEQDRDFLANIIRRKPDFVFNIAEGKGNTRTRESQVPCILESIGIPYSGSDALSMAITLDKYLTNTVLRSGGIPVPRMFLAENGDELGKTRGIFSGGKKYVVKPRWEGSSKGIFLDSVVGDIAALKKKLRRVLVSYKQPAVIEEFVEKDEITVGVCGNKLPRILGMMRISPQDGQGVDFLYCLENKKDWRTKIKYEPSSVIPRKMQAKLERYALGAYKALGLRDVARIDFRIGTDGIPRVIDVNPLPGLSPVYSDLPILCGLGGITYESLIHAILQESLKRYGYSLR